MSTTTDITTAHDETEKTDVRTALASARIRFRAWRRARPFWGGLLVVASGLEMFFSGQLDFGHIHVQVGVQGMQAMILPLVLVLLGVLVWSMPVHRVFYGVIALILSVYSLIGVNLGGFFIGMILGIVGSVVAVSWLPVSDEPAADADADAGADPSVASSPAGADARSTQELGVDALFAMPGTAGTADSAGLARQADPANPEAVDEPSEPRPFLTTSAEPERPSAAPAHAVRNRRRTSALGIGLLVTALSTGAVTSGAALTGAPVLESAAPGGVGASTSPLCVLDPLHLFCSASTDQTADPAPTASPTATGDATSDASTPQPTGAATDDATSEGPGTDGAAADAPADPALSPATGTPPGPNASNDPTSPSATSSAAPTSGASPSATSSANPYAPGKKAGPALQATSDQPVVPAYTAQLTGTAFNITASWYVGNVTLQRSDGTTVTAMKFTAKKATVPGFRLEVPKAAGSAHGLLATADSITLTGNVVLYATSFSGKLLGIPLSFSPTSPPPSIIPLPSMTDVKIAMVANTADSLSYDNPHQRLY